MSTTGGYKYFCGPEVGPEEIGKEVFGRLQQLLSADFGKERRQKWSQAYRHRYGFDFGAGSTSEVLRDGEQGELSKVRVNNSTTTQQALLGLLLSPKFNWRPIARNSDTGARAAQARAINVLEYYWKVRRMARAVSKWCDKGIRYGESYVFAEWDDRLGPEVLPDGPQQSDMMPAESVDVAPGSGNVPPPDSMPVAPGAELPLPPATEPAEPDDSQLYGSGIEAAHLEPQAAPRMLRDGDFRLHVVLPWDQFTDEEASDAEDCQWRAVRIWMPRGDVIAKWPSTIDGLETASVLSSEQPFDRASRLNAGLKKAADRIAVFFLFHDDTAALEGGREVVLVNAQCVLKDEPLSYQRNPIIRFAPEEQDDSPHGYTTNFDQLGVQDIIDGLESAVATNQLTLATQSIVMDEGTKAGPDEVHGMRVFYKKPGAEMPGALNLTATPKEVFDNLERLPQRQRDIMGLNDISMGQPETAQMNAEAFALLAGMATQRNSPKQQNLLDSVGDLGALVLGELSARVSRERFIAIAGRGSHQQYQEETFTGEQLSGIEQVIVEVGNPLEQSVAGRFQLAQLFLQAGVKMTPDDITQVVESGRLDIVTNPIRDLQLLISHENDELAEGREVPVSIFDDHLAHAVKHGCVMNDPQTRGNPAAVRVAQKHFLGHYVNWFGLPAPIGPNGQPVELTMELVRQMDPMFPVRIRMLLGQQPPPMMGPPPEPGGAPAPGGEPPAGGPPDVAPSLQPPTAPGVGTTVNPQSGAPAGPPM